MTLLNQDAQFEGKLTFDGRVQINGKFRGEIFSEGTLIIGEGAEVDAQIDIDTVLIQGRVNGTINAKTRIEMHPPAIVKGDIASPSLVISDGALFEGSCSMGRDKGQIFDLPRKAAAASAPEPEHQEALELETQPERAQEVDSLF
jgi:cytoskeletal protein CcmA (bactofilin family)